MYACRYVCCVYMYACMKEVRLADLFVCIYVYVCMGTMCVRIYVCYVCMHA
jgi:hypothetical protein